MFYPTISPVNSFRVVFNSYFGANLPLLPDRTLRQISDFKPFAFDDITSQLTMMARSDVRAESLPLGARNANRIADAIQRAESLHRRARGHEAARRNPFDRTGRFAAAPAALSSRSSCPPSTSATMSGRSSRGWSSRFADISWEADLCRRRLARTGRADEVQGYRRQGTAGYGFRPIDPRGLSCAAIEGMLSAAAATLVVMDADFQHDETKSGPCRRCSQTHEARPGDPPAIPTSDPPALV